MFKFLLFILFLFPFQVMSFTNFDECSLLMSKMIEKKEMMDFDTPTHTSYFYHGIEIQKDFKNGIRPYIKRIHPDTLEDDNEMEGYEKNYEIWNEDILTINGIDTLNISEEEFEAEFDKDEIELSFKNVKKTYKFTKKDYSSRELFVTSDIKTINNIDTKNSTFDAVFDVNVTWNDYNLSEIAFNVAKEAEKAVEGSIENTNYLCVLPIDFMLSIGYLLPQMSISNFKTSIDYKELENVVFDYYDPESCDDDCLDEEKEFGIVQLHFTEKYQGTITNPLNLHKFPFDKHDLDINIVFKYDYFYDEPYFSDLQEKTLSSNFSNLVSAEWSFNDHYQIYGSDYLPSTNVRVPTLTLGFEIERAYSYFIFKIIFPIICLLLVCWSTFWISPNELESRVTISIVCLLSLIAYNFVIDTDIPKLSYLTFLDQFILISYLFAGLPTIQTVLSRNVFEKKGNDAATSFDKYFKILVPSIYVFSIASLVVQTEIGFGS